MFGVRCSMFDVFRFAGNPSGQRMIFLFSCARHEARLLQSIAHAARFGPRIESAHGLVELPRGLVAWRWRKSGKTAVVVSRCQRALLGRNISERRVRRK